MNEWIKSLDSDHHELTKCVEELCQLLAQTELSRDQIMQFWEAFAEPDAVEA
jgi:hypothetical protein